MITAKEAKMKRDKEIISKIEGSINEAIVNFKNYTIISNTDLKGIILPMEIQEGLVKLGYKVTPNTARGSFLIDWRD